jgi:hypothetical protein
MWPGSSPRRAWCGNKVEQQHSPSGDKSTCCPGAPSLALCMQEFAETTREEAEKKLKEFNLHEKVGAGTPQHAVSSSQDSSYCTGSPCTADTYARNCCRRLRSMVQAPDQEQMQYYGITNEFQEFIRTLNYSTFRCGRLPASVP